ncbi:MAG: UTP--glucose-1-phosphate uridylyltransferase [Desulfovibrionales bacterium]
MKMNCLLSGNDSVPVMFRSFALKMEEIGMPAIVINLFKCYYTQLLFGDQGKLSEREILPVGDGDVTDYESLNSYSSEGLDALDRLAVIKLNGGLGTTMGLDKTKSLIPVRKGKNFLDIILGQVEAMREDHGIPLPLLLMNSFKTHLETMTRVRDFENPGTGLPLAFVQHRYPKILQKDLSPAGCPSNPELEWNPPGHGDIYTALVTSGTLQRLLNQGFRYAFISNSDNLGAVVDERILGFMVRKEIPFVMEVARRSPSDRKGGHLTRLFKNGRFALRETAQCPDNELDSFSDIEKHRFFNTNSLWLDLKAFEKVFLEKLNMPLDVILNKKTLDPRNPKTPEVIQLETAMGSAITSFEKARAVLVPRTRFAPVKTTSDLLLVMSDCYRLNERNVIEPHPSRSESMPQVELDPRFFGKVDDFLARFPDGPPSLAGCDRFQVKGDVLFKGAVTVKGSVRISNNSASQIVIGPDAVMEKDIVVPRGDT